MASKLVKRGILAWQDESKKLSGSGHDELAPLLQDSAGLPSVLTAEDVQLVANNQMREL